MRKIMIIALILGFLAGTALGAETPQDALQVMGPQTAAKVTFQTMEAGKVLVSVTDDQDAPILGLNAEQFTIRKGPKTAKILSAEPLATSKEVGLNIVMVVDNSQSMQMRHAVQPLRSLETGAASRDTRGHTSSCRRLRLCEGRAPPSP